MQVEFAYAQGRVQARNGARLSPGAWQSLAASRTLAHYLHAARGTSFRSWVQQLGEHAEAHEIERALRADWRKQVGTISAWLPERWRAAMLFAATLPDLPVATHIARDGLVAPWMLEDDRLRRHAGPAEAGTADAYAPGLAPVVRDVTHGMRPLQAWLASWQTTWPEKPEESTGLKDLTRRIDEFASGPELLSLRRDRLERRMLGIIRRWRLTPAAAFASVVLLALDLQRLRGGLLRRACFAADRE